jgi:hypothetical protein
LKEWPVSLVIEARQKLGVQPRKFGEGRFLFFEICANAKEIITAVKVSKSWHRRYDIQYNNKKRDTPHNDSVVMPNFAKEPFMLSRHGRDWKHRQY